MTGIIELIEEGIKICEKWSLDERRSLLIECSYKLLQMFKSTNADYYNSIMTLVCCGFIPIACSGIEEHEKMKKEVEDWMNGNEKGIPYDNKL